MKRTTGSAIYVMELWLWDDFKRLSQYPKCSPPQTESFECLSKFIPSLPIQNLLQKANYKCNKNIYLCIYSFSYMLHMQLVQHSIIFPVLFYLNLHFSLLIRVIQNPSIITIFTIHIPKIHSFTFWNCFISFP